MSENFYNYLKKYNKILELPVSNVLLFTAIGKKSAHVKQQILCDIKVENFQCSSSFLIVPHLSNPIILGNDWLLENRAIVDYEKKMIFIRGVPVDSSIVSFGNLSKVELDLSSAPDNIYYIQDLTVIGNDNDNDNNNNQCVINNLNREKENEIMNVDRKIQELEICQGDVVQSNLFMQNEEMSQREGLKEYYFVSDYDESSSSYCDVIFEGDIQNSEDI